jgi:hypothetical protein
MSMFLFRGAGCDYVLSVFANDKLGLLYCQCKVNPISQVCLPRASLCALESARLLFPPVLRECLRVH